MRDLISLVVHTSVCLGKTLKPLQGASVVLGNEYMARLGLNTSNEGLQELA